MNVNSFNSVSLVKSAVLSNSLTITCPYSFASRLVLKPCLIVSVVSIVISVTIFGLLKDWLMAVFIGSSIAVALIFYFGSYIKRNMWQLFSELQGLNKIYWENDKDV